MNVIVNIEIFILIHRSTCQYALNAPYQYQRTQGAYYVQYDDEEYTKKRKSYIDYDISVRIDQKRKRLKCKCYFKDCKKKKKHKGCCCPYQQDNQQYNDKYSPDNKMPSAVYPPFSINPYPFYTLPNNMFPPAFFPFPNFSWVSITTANPTKTLSPSTETKVTETKTPNTEGDGDKDKDKNINKDRDKDKDKDENKDKDKDENRDNDIDKDKHSDKDKDRDKEENITSKTTHQDVVTKSTIPYTIVSLKPSRLFLKDIPNIKPCRKRHCIRNDKKIGRYYHKDIIVRPTLSYPNRRKLENSDYTLFQKML